MPTDPRGVLSAKLDILEREVPRYVFATKNPFRVIFRTESGSEVGGNLRKMISRSPVGPIGFLLPGSPFDPGSLSSLVYEGITLYDHGATFGSGKDYPFGVAGDTHFLEMGTEADLAYHAACLFDRYRFFADDHELMPGWMRKFS